jgi:Zn-dependent protease with chaperone function
MAPWLSFGGGDWSGLAHAALAALLTYTLHCWVWTLAAAVLVRWAGMPSRARSAWWRVAVLAPIATAGLALAASLGLAHGSTVPLGPAVRVAWVQGTVPLPQGISWGNLPWTALGGLVLIGALGGLARWFVQALLLARGLRGRTAVIDARWLERMERLRLRTHLGRVRLTQSPWVSSPLVLGVAEICVPVGLLSLGDAELDSVLAHELSHLERRDGIWFPLVGVAAAALWLQPVCAWAAARFRESAEQACDDRAVELTRDAVGLARVLLQLASAASARVGSALAPSMANSKRALLGRIRRLTCDRPIEPARAHRYGALVAGLGLAVLVAVSSGLSVSVALARPLFPTSAALAAKKAASASGVRALELEQELRHLLARERWLAEAGDDGSLHEPSRGGQP